MNKKVKTGTYTAIGILGALIAAFLILSFTYGRHGHTSDAEITVRETELYSEAQMQAAAELIRRTFEAEYGGCKLRRLYSAQENPAAWMQTDGLDETEYVVFILDFYGYPLFTTKANHRGDHAFWRMILHAEEDGTWTIYKVRYG